MEDFGDLTHWRQRFDRWKSHLDSSLDRLFPERQIHLRTEGRVSFVSLSRQAQIRIVLVLAVCGGWMAYSSVTYVLHDRLLAGKDDQIANARIAYHGLLNEVAEYQKQFTTIARDVEANNSLMFGYVERNRVLDTELEKQLSESKEDRQTLTSARVNLQSKLTDVEKEMRALANRNFSLKGDLDNIGSDLQMALAERNEALFEGTELRRKLQTLEERLQHLQVSEEVAVKQVAQRTEDYIVSLESIVDRTGLKVDRLLAAAGHGLDIDDFESGQGGPFIDAQSDGLPAGRLRADLTSLETRIERWDTLKKLMKSLPLAAPMKFYYVTSTFGKRRDPINKRWASHYGLDLGGTLKSPVYATAPGVVTHAGWKGKYGKFVEIDHGAGVKTRYGHLHSFLVKKGQKVGFHDKIARLGSTGRSTGAHLHYEVTFKGKPVNPAKMIKAGRYVFKE